MNIVDIIAKENIQRGDHKAIADPNRELTYGELLTAVNDTSEALAQHGISRYERIALYYSDGIDYIIIALAVLKLDAVIVPISPSYSFDDIGSAMNTIDIAWLISEEKIDAYESSKLSCQAVANLFIHAGSPTKHMPEEYFDCEPAFVRFSSGTTGDSKGVLISHQAILERTDAADKSLCVTEADTVLWLLSMSFHFVVTILLFLRRGAFVLLCSNTFPGDLLANLQRGHGTFIYASPFHYRLLSQSSELNSDHLANVRMAVSTAMSLSDNIASDFMARFGVALSQAYGIIEVGLPFVEKVADGHTNGAVGKIGPDYEIKLLDDNEILLRGSGMFTAYFDPWQTLHDLDDDGWFHTGDIGHIDQEGRLFIDARKKELINFAGMKIFPREIEAVLNQHESIEDSLVYGIHDDTYGQLPAATVSLKGDTFDEKSVRRFCYSRLPSYKVPKSFEVTASIAKTHSGKKIRK